MYKQYLETRDNKIGKGIFTTVVIPSNTPVLEVTGPILLDREVRDMNDSALLQVGPNTYLGASGSLDDYLGHSCDPNCKIHVVGNRAIIYSLYVIPAGNEITVDYSTTSTDTLNSWKMDCKCGSYKCRKIISGYYYLDNVLFENYKERGMLPLYILEPDLIQKR